MKKIFNAFLYSMNGLRILLKERAFLQELLLLPVVVCVVYLCHSPCMKAYIAFSYVLVLITEALNTAIEKTVNRISTEIHQLSKEIKDISSAAVFIALTNFVIGCLIGLTTLYSVFSL